MQAASRAAAAVTTTLRPTATIDKTQDDGVDDRRESLLQGAKVMTDRRIRENLIVLLRCHLSVNRSINDRGASKNCRGQTDCFWNHW